MNHRHQYFAWEPAPRKSWLARLDRALAPIMPTLILAFMAFIAMEIAYAIL
jgi:hypothetical protein